MDSFASPRSQVAHDRSRRPRLYGPLLIPVSPAGGVSCAGDQFQHGARADRALARKRGGLRPRRRHSCSGSVRDQKPQFRFKADALFANQRRSVGIDALIVVGPGVAHGDYAPLPHRPFAVGWGMLLVGEFAFYLAVGACVAAVTKEEGV